MENYLRKNLVYSQDLQPNFELLSQQQDLLNAENAREKLNSHLKKRMSSPPTAAPAPAKKQKKPKRSDEDTETREDVVREKVHDKQKPDILTTILNQKKLSLMHEPEIVAFLHKFTSEIKRQ